MFAGKARSLSLKGASLG
jgi:hypothetical protein